MSLWIFHELNKLSWIAPSSLWIGSLILLLTGLLAVLVYRLVLSPLASVPGPWYACVSSVWITWQLATLQRCYAIDKLFKIYGPIVRVAPNMVVFLDSATAKSVYSNSRRLHKSDFYSNMKVNDMDTSLTLLDPANHAVRRKAFGSHYTPTNLHQSESDLHDAVQELLQYLETAGRYPNKTHDLLSLLRRFLSDVNCIHLFGYRSNSFHLLAENSSGVDDTISRAIHDFPSSTIIRSALPRWLWKIISDFPNSRWRLFCSSGKIMHDFGRARVIEARTRYEAGKLDSEKLSLLERLLVGSQMQEQEIITEVSAHLMAGTDTTATTLSFMLWELSRRPDVAFKLRTELDKVMPDSRNIPDVQVLQGLPYLSAFILEALRMYSAVPGPLERVVPETVSEPFALLDHIIPAGTIIGTQAYSSQRIDSLFPNPDFFEPERWLHSLREAEPSELIAQSTSAVNSADMYSAMMPFGIGPRVCGGQNMAQMTMRIVVAAVARNFDLYTPAETTEISMKGRDGFTIFPAARVCKIGFSLRRQ